MYTDMLSSSPIPDLVLILQESGSSLQRVLIGFSYGVLGGGVLALFCVFFPKTGKLLGFGLELFRSIPPIAWIPLALIIFGTGNFSAYFVIFIASFFPIFTNFKTGLSNVPKIYLEVSHTLRINQRANFLEVQIPASLPVIFSGLKIALGFAWMCVVVAEMISSRSGLGYQIDLNRQLLRLDRVIVFMAIIGFWGVVMQLILNRIERYLMPWNQLQAKESGVLSDKSKNYESSEKVALTASIATELQIKNLWVAYHNQLPVLRGIDFKVSPGEIIAIVGLSGCGKSSLLRAIAGLIPCQSGKVKLTALQNREARITLMPQGCSLFPWKNNLENIEFGMRDQGLRPEQVRAQSFKYLDALNLRAKALSYPAQLSGGEQQRITLARALAFRPDLLLMDEPFSALDFFTREALQLEVRNLLKNEGTSALWVTHDLTEALIVADRVFVLSPGTGAISAIVGTTTLGARNSRTRFLPKFSQLHETLAEALLAEPSDRDKVEGISPWIKLQNGSNRKATQALLS